LILPYAPSSVLLCVVGKRNSFFCACNTHPLFHFHRTHTIKTTTPHTHTTSFFFQGQLCCVSSSSCAHIFLSTLQKSLFTVSAEKAQNHVVQGRNYYWHHQT
jgi:hypothetical protein